MTQADTSLDGSIPSERGSMEPVIAAVVTGALMRVDVLASDSRSQVMIKGKLDIL